MFLCILRVRHPVGVRRRAKNFAWSTVSCGYPIPKREEFVHGVTFIDSTGILQRPKIQQIITKEFS